MKAMRLVLTIEQNGVRRHAEHILTPGILQMAADSRSEIIAYAVAHLSYKLAKEFAELDNEKKYSPDPKVFPENADKDIVNNEGGNDGDQNSSC